MSAWSTTNLQVGYPRSIVGFDLRVSEGRRVEVVGHVSSDTHLPSSAIVTIDPEVWKRNAEYKTEDDRNGFNLIDGPVENLLSGVSASDALLVAFDLPVSLINELTSTFGLRAIAIERVSSNPRWRRVGFDVVDIRTESSAFHSFEWQGDELAALLDRVSNGLNRWGLLDSEAAAITICGRADSMNPTHAPFAPCGIWLVN